MIFMLIFIFIIGLCFGSFLNVVIYRTENNISIVLPPSFCPKCKAPIKWYDNIPLLSYIILGGRCRNCKTRISIVYPLVEFLSAAITVIFFLKWRGDIPWFISSTAIAYLLIVVSVIDFKTMMLSDLFSYLIAFFGLVGSFSNPLFDGSIYQRIITSLAGIIAGAGSMFLLAWLGKLLYKKDAVGEGDMFLFGAIGSIVGAKGIIDVIIIASFVGAVYGISLILAKKLDRFSYMPFGPFLAIGCVIKFYFNISFMKIFS
jgi:leader peptidase (prepilin peptidase)/N-methyltransferase